MYVRGALLAVKSEATEFLARLSDVAVNNVKLRHWSIVYPETIDCTS